MEENNHSLQAEKRYLLFKQTAFVLLAVFLFIYGIIAIRNFLYPIAFGFILAYLGYPLTSWLEMKGFPRILANFIVILGTLALIIGLIIAAYHIITPVAINLSNLADRVIDNLTEMSISAGQYFGIDTSNIDEIISRRVGSAFEAGGEQLGNVFSATTNTIVAFGLLPVYIFLFLFYRTKFMYFLLQLAGRSRRGEMVTMLREIAAVMVRYLGGVFIVVFILFFINSIGLWIIGLQFAIPLGVAAALFNFIPYFGTLLGGLVPLTFAILVEGSPVLAFKVVMLFVIIQFIENNILTPNIVGGNVKVNPFFIITGLVAASMIWGIPGMLLVVPFLASLRIIFKHIDFMHPYAFLLGEEGTEKHSIQMSKLKRITKRFINGAGERGNDNEKQLVHGAAFFASAENRANFPAIVVFPQCAEDDFWANYTNHFDQKGIRSLSFDPSCEPLPSMRLAIKLLESMLQNDWVDKNRIYLGGLSMGGMGAFELLYRMPQVFAAAFPICGGGNPEMINKKANKVNVWIFHGKDDTVVPARLSEEMFDAYQKAGATVKLTLYPGVGHNAWDYVFQEPQLLPWLFSNCL